MPGDSLTVERVIPAPPEAIFDLLADASEHPRIDGSGTVKESKDAPQRLTLGSEFGMAMKQGMRYSMVNKVVEFDQNRRIAWAPRMTGPFGGLFKGRVWRYELEPVDGGTRVRETWDISGEKVGFLLKRSWMPKQIQRNMEKTLARIEELLAAANASR